MSKTATTAFNALRLRCAYSATPRHEDLLSTLSVNVDRFGMGVQEAMAMYFNSRIGLIASTSTIGNTWIQRDCSADWRDTLHFEVTSLSAN